MFSGKKPDAMFERLHAWLDSGFLRKLVRPAVAAEGGLDGESFRRCVSWWRTPKYLHDGLSKSLKPTPRWAHSRCSGRFVSHPGEFNLCTVIWGCSCVKIAEARKCLLWLNTKAFFAGENAGAAAAGRPACVFQVADQPRLSLQCFTPFRPFTHQTEPRRLI